MADENNKILMSEEQKQSFKELLKIAVYKQLYENGFLTQVQLTALLKMQNRR